MTWKDIEENFYQKEITDPSSIIDFFKSQFKQAMEEMVGDKVECTKEEWAHHKNRWQQEEHNKFRQEILDKLNKFFE